MTKRGKCGGNSQAMTRTQRDFDYAGIHKRGKAFLLCSPE